jgi:hypothetical protein
VKVEKNNRYLTQVGVLEYITSFVAEDVSADLEEVGYYTKYGDTVYEFKVPSRMARAYFTDLRKVYAPYGYKYYLTSTGWKELDFSTVVNETAEFVSDKDGEYADNDSNRFLEDDTFSYRTVQGNTLPAAEMQDILQWQNENPYMQRLNGITQDNTVTKDYVEEYFASQEDADAAYLQFEKDAEKDGYYGWSEEKEERWSDFLLKQKEQSVKVKAQRALLAQSLEDKIENFERVLKTSSLPDRNSAEVWKEKLIDALKQLEPQSDLPSLRKQEEIAYDNVWKELDNARIEYRKASERYDYRMEKTVKQLEIRQGGSRKQLIASKQQQIHLLQESHDYVRAKELTQSLLNMLKEYQADIDKQLELAIINTSPLYFKVLVLDDLWFKYNRGVSL